MGIIHHNNFAYLKGPKGDRGPIGPTGDRGLKGDKGDRGDRGPQGLAADNSIIRGLISGSAPIIYNEITGEISFDIASYATKEYVDTAINDSLLFSSDDLVEGEINLYYTDTRSRNALYAGTGVVYNPATGEIAIGQSVATTDNVIFGNINASGDVQIDGNLVVHGTTITINATELAIADNMIYLNDGNATANPDLGFAGNYNDGTYAHAGFFRDATDGYWKVFDGYTLEPDASPWINTADPSFNLAKIWATEFKGNLEGNATTATRLETPRNISGIAFDGTSDIVLNTTNIAEGTNNYFTPDRARTSISASGDLTYDNETGIMSYTTPTSDGIAEGAGNLYFTDSRVRNAINVSGSLSYNSTTGIISYTTPTTLSSFTNDVGFITSVNWSQVLDKPIFSTVATSGSYLDLTDQPIIPGIPADISYFNNDSGYITISQARAAISAGSGISYNSSTGVVSSTITQYTDALAISANTTAIASAKSEAVAIAAGDATSKVAAEAAARDVAITLALATKDNTDEITEGSTNLYFTNSRARSAISAGSGISYNSSTGVVSSTITQYTDANARAAISASGDLSYNSITGQISFTQDRSFASLTGKPTTIAGYGITNAYTKIEVDSAISSALATKDNTDEITEGSTNLYFTNSRARSAISAGSGISYNSSTGVISADTSVATTSYVDTAISNLVGGASAAYDTLKEIQDAMATDAELSAAISSITIGNATQTITAGSYLTGGGSFTANQTSNSSITIAVNATSGNIASTVVARDVSGNFSAGIITALFNGNLTGNAATASKLETARTINGESFDGTANISFSTSSVSEGTNLYYTNARVRSAINVGGNLTYNNATGTISYTTPNTSGIAEGTNLYYTDARARAAHSFVAGSGAYNSTTGVITIPTNTNQLTNGAGFITGYSETDTLASVTARGATTSAALSTGALTVNGAITATGEVTAYYSDGNLKKDIIEIPNPIEKVLSLRGVTFRPNETALSLGIPDKEEVGVIAQEVEAVLPQLVTDSAYHGYKTVKYDKLTALLIEAVKQQQDQITALQIEIAKLKENKDI
jgi:Chaperone of endosialidase